MTFKQFIVEAQFNSPSFGDISQIMAQFDHLQENPNEQNIKDFVVNWGQPFKTFLNDIQQLANKYDLNSSNDSRQARQFNSWLRRVTAFSKDVATFHNVQPHEMEAHLMYYRETIKNLVMEIRAGADMPPEIQNLLNQFASYVNRSSPLLDVVRRIPTEITPQEWPF